MIKIVNLEVEFVTPLEKKVILKNINLNLEMNNLVVIVGASGSGKSTLLDVITLNNLNFSGSYYFRNNNVKMLNTNDIKRRIVYLNQGQALFAKLNALDNTKLINSRITSTIFDAVMTRFGLGKIKHKTIEFLSGGEKQRAGIVRSISKTCDLLVLDEPTSSLDSENKRYFIEEISKFKSEKLIIIATHDKDLIKQADIVLSLDGGHLTFRRKNKRKDQFPKLKSEVSKHSVGDLIIKDLFINKKRLLLFISAMSNGLLGLLMGFVIVSGFEDMFISILVDQVATELSVAYPNTKLNRFELKYKYVYLSDEPITISSEYINFVDTTVDLINSSIIDNNLISNQIVLFLNEADYDKYQLNTNIFNMNELNLKYNNNTQKLMVKSVIKSDQNKIMVSKDFKDIVVNGLGLQQIYIKTKVLNMMTNDPSNNVLISELASTYRLTKKDNYIIEGEPGNYFNQFDLNSFKDYLICNPYYLIYCDLNSATAYIELVINGSSRFIKVNNGALISLSSELFKNLNSAKIEIYFKDFLVLSTDNYTVFDSSEFELTMPYNLFSGHLKSYYGPLIQANHLLINQENQLFNTVSNYKIVSPYDTYLLSFKEILDAVFIGFLVYSLISLLLGVVTVSVLIILELDSRKKHIGTLMLLGWSSNQIRIWVVSNSIIKTILTILITSAMIQISINTLNVVIKEVSTILIVFNYPPIKIMLILIISLLLIIGNISLFHVNFLLKNPPKKLISET